MNLAVTLVLAVSAVIAAGYSVYLAVVNMRLEKLVSNSHAHFEMMRQMVADLMEENQRCNDRLVLKTTAVMIMTMTIYALQGDDEKRSMCRNRLHFWGVPFETLDDTERLVDFLDKCLGESIKVHDGQPPYSFRFEESVSSQEGWQANKEQQSKKEVQNEERD